MLIYQIKKGDLYYRRGTKGHHGWVGRDKASVWSNLKGVTCALNQVHRRGDTGEIIKTPFAWPNLTIVECGDWGGLYADGKLLCQGLELEPTHILNSLGFQVFEKVLAPGYMFGKPSLPDYLEDLP